jgi:hypothetical protein
LYRNIPEREKMGTNVGFVGRPESIATDWQIDLATYGGNRYRGCNSRVWHTAT